MSRLDDTSHCPQADRCAACGYRDPRRLFLAVCTFDTPVGVYCQTLCDGCVTDERWPRLAVAEAIELVGAHCVHLGVDLDQMAALMSAEKEGQR